MFGSRRKSRIVEVGPLPGNNSLNVNSNALAAASAIGQALKTGQPIPRSNSLQRTSSLQRSSLQHGKPGSRTSSLMTNHQRSNSLRVFSKPPSKSNSFSTSNSGSTIVLPPRAKPTTMKKHVPGPHGLITIEVPLEEESASRASSLASKPRRKPSVKKSAGFSKPKPNYATTGEQYTQKSLNSLNSVSRKPIIEDPIQEDVPTVFESPPIVEKATDVDLLKSKNDSETHLDGIVEEDPVPVITNELEEFKLQERQQEHVILNDLKNEEKQVNRILSNTLEMIDQYEDSPSTAKSQISISDGSTIDTEVSVMETSKLPPETDSTEKEQDDNTGSSMAQHLRSTIPNLVVSSHEKLDSNSINASSTDNIDVASSLYSSDMESARVSSQRFSPEAENIIYSSTSQEEEEQGGMTKAIKKSSSLVPKKSALKYKTSTSSINLSDPQNAAADVYLSLTTAENTRLNARPSVKANNERPRSNSQTQVKPKRLISSNPKESPSKTKPQRPNSVADSKQQTRTRTASNAAAVNATLKKNEIQKPIQRTSSFEKTVNTDPNTNSAFKRRSLRDPSFGNRPATMESNLGYYRNQAATQQQRPAGIAAQPGFHSQQPVSLKSNSIQPPPPQTNGSSSRFKSRFDDSDSEDDQPINTKVFSGNNYQTLKKPKSQHTLRSSSNNVVMDKSPAKSLPVDNHRGTRFFSENIHSQHEHHMEEKEEKKKRSFGGKLKKLFGRSKD